MTYMDMTISDFINGLFALILVIVGAIIGILIMLKYRNYKTKTFLYWGILWCGIYTAWWGASLSFINVLITQQTIPDQLYMFLGAFFIPFFMTSWWFGLTELILEDKRKKIVIIYLIIMMSYNVYLITALMIDPAIIGTIDGFDITYNNIPIVYMLFINFTIVITGFIFALDNRNSATKKNRIKSSFILIAYLSYLIGGIADASFLASSNDIVLIIVRLILISGAIFFYIGLFMPKFILKLLRIEDDK